MLGAFSYFLDGMAADAAQAGVLHGTPSLSQQGVRGGKRDRSPLELLLSPAVPLLAALQPCRGMLNDASEEVVGCKVIRRQ